MRKALPLLFAASLLGWNIEAWAANAVSVPLSTTITLLEETPVYHEPDDSSVPIAALAPQNVQITGAEKDWLSIHRDSDQIWFQVQTWLGVKWAALEFRQLGLIRHQEQSLWLSQETPLYGSPLGDRKTEYTLSPQTVYSMSRYQSKLQTSYLVDTWTGPQWIIPMQREVFPVSPVSGQLTLPTPTSMFASPFPEHGEKGLLEPQQVSILAMYQTDWYQVRTSTGEEAWVHRSYAEPEGAQTTDESVVLTSVTPLRKYPNVYDIKMGSLAPQVVKASARWTSPHGEVWHRITTWQGSAWIRSEAKAPRLTMEAALTIARQLASSEALQWSAEFITDLPEEQSGEARPAWIVIARSPAGNLMKVSIDAITGKVLALTELESHGTTDLDTSASD